jgi:hypothetical protein
MKKTIDRHGQPYAMAIGKLAPKARSWPYIIRMVRGIFVIKWIPVWRPCPEFPRYAALGPKGRVVSGIGSRKDTITAAGGRMD